MTCSHRPARASRSVSGRRHTTHRLTSAVKATWRKTFKLGTQFTNSSRAARTTRRCSNTRSLCKVHFIAFLMTRFREPVFTFQPVSSPSARKRWESLERHGLSRAHSLRMHGSAYGEEGLKRVCSAPQLGDQEKASLLKRKLSVSDTEPCLVDRGSNKYKKQGWNTFPFFSVLFSKKFSEPTLAKTDVL